MSTGMIGQFLGSSFPKLRVGQILTGPFEQTANFHPDAVVVPFGSLLKFGSSKKYYAVMAGTETDATLFAGIAVAEIAGSPTSYPGTKTQYEIGEAGSVLVMGSIAVPFATTSNADVANATEGAAVYLDRATGLVTDADEDTAGTPVAHIAIPNLVFTGDSDTVDGVLLVGVKKLY